MPSNKMQREEFHCRRKVDEIIKSNLPLSRDGILLNDLVLQMTLMFPVNPGTIENFIKKFYIETGVVVYKDNRLYAVKQ